MAYRVEDIGVGRPRLLWLRWQVLGAARGPRKRRWLTLSLAMLGKLRSDPGVQLPARAIRKWATAAWQGQISAHD
eukprot:11912297-Alexandrium_andersonii.AAC.1